LSQSNDGGAVGFSWFRTQGRVNYRPDIDGLRAISILAVILFHAGVPFLGGGFVGVDVFFVISGYLIGSHVFKQVSNGTFSYRDFYIRRTKRILPAALAVIVAVLVLGCLLLDSRELKSLAAQVVASVASVSNIFYWYETSYFSPSAELKPLLMTWSLGIEEQFYLFFPVVVVTVLRFRRSLALPVLWALSVISLIVSVLAIRHDHAGSAFFLLPYRWWELGAGTILGIVEVQRGGPMRKTRVTNELLGVAGLAAILVSAFVYDAHTPFPGLAALAPVAGAVAVLAAQGSWINRRVLSFRPLVVVGLISYSIYLWHWPLLSFGAILSGEHMTASVRALLVGASLVLGVLSYRYIEVPFRRAAGSGATLWRYAATSGAIAAVGAVLIFAHGWHGRYSRAEAIETSVGTYETCLGMDTATTPVRGSLCGPAHLHQPTVALLGDSHATALGSSLRDGASRSGDALVIYAKQACPSTGLATATYGYRGQCESFNQDVLRELVSDPDVVLVVFASSWLRPFAPSNRGSLYLFHGQTGGTLEDSWRNLEAGLRDSVQRMRSAGKAVVLLDDDPTLDADPRLIALANAIPLRQLGADLVASPRPQFEREAHVRTSDEIRMRGVLDRIAGSTGARVWSAYDRLCDATSCEIIANGVPLYADSNHLTPAGAAIATAQGGLFSPSGRRAPVKR
jgi:peptidoglycan/LPS O-acetylase OafA/YrhL